MAAQGGDGTGTGRLDSRGGILWGRAMLLDVLDLRAFYYERLLGRVVQQVLRQRLVGWWPPEGCTGMTVAGYGFAAPMLRPWLGQARRVVALMPGGQGVMAWPAGLPNHSVLCHEDAWPLEAGSVDRLVLLHGLEFADHAVQVLAEAARVLGPGGRVAVMVPNRSGLWARSEGTPFGFGRSYTAGQLEAHARQAGFSVERSGAALYIPPSDRRFWLRSAAFWERTGTRISKVLIAGILLVELSKRSRAPIGTGAPAAVPSPLEVLGGIVRPRPGRAGIRRPVANSGLHERLPDPAADPPR